MAECNKCAEEHRGEKAKSFLYGLAVGGVASASLFTFFILLLIKVG